MIVLFAVSLVVSFGALVAASRLPDEQWTTALHVLEVSLAFTAMSALGAVAGFLRKRGHRWPTALLPLVSGGVAISFRSALEDRLAPPAALEQIDFMSDLFGALAAVSALFALVTAIALLSEQKTGKKTPLGTASRWVIGGASLTAAFWVAGPLLLRVGVPLDHRAFLSLAALGVGAFAIVEARRKVNRRGK